jgi:VWFA-related protein
MSRKQKILLIALGAVALLVAIRALKLQAQDLPTISVNVKVVNVLASVRDRNGQIVRNLTKEDFRLEEDGRPQNVRYFARESDLPLTLGLMVDTSLSQRNLIDEERSASYRFLDSVLREDRDSAFLLHFDWQVELLQDVTSSKQQLDVAMRDVEVTRSNSSGFGRRRASYPRGNGGARPGVGTLLYEAVQLASDQLMRQQTGRKALIVLTDGVDQGSRISLDDAIEAAQRADTMVYGILFYDPSAYNAGSINIGPFGIPIGRGRGDGKKVLDRMSRETGGRMFEVARGQSISDIYRQIQDELRNQYNLGFSSDRPATQQQYRKLRLSTKYSDLTVQARNGYYAKP